MDSINWEIIKDLIRALARWILVIAAAELVRLGVFTEQQSDAFISQGVLVLLAVVTIAAPLVWKFLSARHKNRLVQKALNAPANTTLAKVKRDLKREGI